MEYKFRIRTKFGDIRIGKVSYIASIVTQSSELISRATGEMAMQCLLQDGWILEKGGTKVI